MEHRSVQKEFARLAAPGKAIFSFFTSFSDLDKNFEAPTRNPNQSPFSQHSLWFLCTLLFQTSRMAGEPDFGVPCLTFFRSLYLALFAC